MSKITERLQGVLTYVAKLVELSEKTVFSCRDYRSLVYFEHQLRDREGVSLDMDAADGPTWLRVNRLAQRDPPTPGEKIEDWLVIGSSPGVAPKVLETRVCAMPRSEADRLVECGIADRHDVMVPPSGDPQTADVRLRLDRHPELKALVKKYVDETWRAWSSQEEVRRQTIDIYNKFFSVYQMIENAGAESPTEIVIGVGVAIWNVDGKRIEHPLIELPVEIQLDPTSHAVLVRSRGLEPHMYLRPFSELNNPGVEDVRRFAFKHFDTLETINGELPVEMPEVTPFRPSTFEPILRCAAGLLSDGGRYYPDHCVGQPVRDLPKPTETLTITDTWSIYARPRSGSTLTRDVEQLQKAAAACTDSTLPAIAKRLNADPSSEPDEEEGDAANWGQTPSGGTEAAFDVLFPKPFNDAQLKIARDLERRDGLVVQGPPGTGKTHTIANIICHYLATGRRVLVASKGEPALEVLRQQIPAGVRETAMSFLTKQREGLRQLHATVKHILDAAKNDPEYRAGLDREAKLEAQKAEECRRILSDVESKIKAIAQSQLDEFVPESLAGHPRQRPKDAAKHLAEQGDRFGWFDDALGYGGEHAPRFSESDVDGLRDARRQLAADLEYVGRRLPTASNVDDADSVAAIHVAMLRMEQIRDSATVSRLRLIDPKLPGAAGRLEAAVIGLRDLSRVWSDVTTTPWLGGLLLGWLSGGDLAPQLRPLAALCTEIEEAEQSRQQFVTCRVSLPEFGADRENVITAVKRAREGRAGFPWWELFGAAKAKKLLRQIRISSHPPRSTADWAHVYARLRHQEKTLAIAERWNALRRENCPELPEAPTAFAELDSWTASAAGAIGDVTRAVQAYRDGTAGCITDLFGESFDVTAAVSGKERVDEAVRLLELNAEWVQVSAVAARRAGLLRRLEPYHGGVAEQMRAFLQSTLGDRRRTSGDIASSWLRLFTELRRIWTQQPHLDTVTRVAALVEASGARRWAQRLRRDPAIRGSDPTCPDDWRAAWSHARLKAYLAAIEGHQEMRRLSDSKAEYERRLSQAVSRIVELKTCLGLCRTMTDARRNALQIVVKGIEYLTKTPNGVLAGYWRRAVREAMPECVRAVPCWIMPTWRVSETVPSELGLFDLVIVDEASQSDALAVPAVLRAKKLLIVGDDRQVSPTPVGIPFQKILQLQAQYLPGHPFRSSLLPGGSLYDLGQSMFGQAEMLNEHFRCVEPIIRFSFHFYANKIAPLRIPKASERLDPPLVDVFVTNGGRDARKVNRAEVVAIADEIEQLVNDPAFRDRTLGVVTLLGSAQAAEIQRVLLERLGEEAFLRHRIACGDAATFQGNERDIMFVSMVASPGKATAQTAKLFEQRFNVALSRARDRMYLFRSVGREHLPNERDLKRRVIDHFENPMPPAISEDDEKEFESGFEKEFFSRLVTLGYRVTPQVGVGAFRIDMVVQGDKNRRLAIELDGDRWHNTSEKWLEDWSRQKILERMGWTFWRCWASSFYLNPDECMADLVRTLEEMQIHPGGGVISNGHHTVHRRVTVNLSDSPDDKPSSDEVVEIGDRLVVTFEKGSQQHCLFTLTADKDDPVNGLLSANEPAGQAILGKGLEDEVELPWNGELCRAVIVEIEKKRNDNTAVCGPSPTPPAPPPAEPSPPPQLPPKAPPVKSGSPQPKPPPTASPPTAPAPTAAVTDRERQVIVAALKSVGTKLIRWKLFDTARLSQERFGAAIQVLVQEGVVQELNERDGVRYTLL